jgi:hypothetical protein
MSGRRLPDRLARELADRYALAGYQQTLERQSTVLTKLAAAAVG